MSFGFPAAVIETPEGRDPCPPGPAGPVLGDTLAAVAASAHAASAHAAIRWHGRPEAGLDALTGRLGLAAALAPAPGS